MSHPLIFFLKIARNGAFCCIFMAFTNEGKLLPTVVICHKNSGQYSLFWDFFWRGGELALLIPFVDAQQNCVIPANTAP